MNRKPAYSRRAFVKSAVSSGVGIALTAGISDKNNRDFSTGIGDKNKESQKIGAYTLEQLRDQYKLALLNEKNLFNGSMVRLLPRGGDVCPQDKRGW